MKTDELVAALSMSVEPVNRRLINRGVGIGVAVGTIVALAIMLVGFGIRAYLTTPRAVIFLLIKPAFAFAIVGVASVYLLRLSRPGGERRISAGLALIPFVLI